MSDDNSKITDTNPASYDQVIEDWFRDLLGSIPVLRETHHYNHLRGAVDDLKKRVK